MDDKMRLDSIRKRIEAVTSSKVYHENEAQLAIEQLAILRKEYAKQLRISSSYKSSDVTAAKINLRVARCHKDMLEKELQRITVNLAQPFCEDETEMTILEISVNELQLALSDQNDKIYRLERYLRDNGGMR